MLTTPGHEEPVEGLAVGVGLGAIGGDEEVVEARHVVPGDRPRADGEVPPAVGDAELAEIDEADCSTTIEEDVGRAAVAVADRRLIPNADHPDRWAVTEARRRSSSEAIGFVSTPSGR